MSLTIFTGLKKNVLIIVYIVIIPASPSTIDFQNVSKKGATASKLKCSPKTIISCLGKYT